MTRTKRIVVTLCSIAAAAMTACAFAACEDDEQEHRLTHHAAVAPTCTEAGSVEYWSCSDCDKLFADEDASEEITDVTVPATGHNWEDAEVVKVATYTQAGSKKQVCTECEEEQTVTLEALEYTADATVEAGESISAAIEAAQDGDVIVVKAGTYAEQLFIQDKDITIIGEGEVIVSGPANYDDLQSVAKIAGESMDYTALVAVVNGDVTIENITVRGDIEAARASLKVTHNTRYLGVAAINASLTLNYVDVEDIRFTEDYLGMQNGIGVYGVATDAQKEVVMRYSSVTNFNKGAIVMRASVANFVCDGCTIAGVGEQAITAQNGIQVACAATITNNAVKDMKYSADNEWTHGSVGIYVLTEEADSVTVTGNTLENVDNGIYGYVNGAVANSETAKEDNTFTDLYEEGYDFYETPAAVDAE